MQALLEEQPSDQIGRRAVPPAEGGLSRRRGNRVAVRLPEELDSDRPDGELQRWGVLPAEGGQQYGGQRDTEPKPGPAGGQRQPAEHTEVQRVLQRNDDGHEAGQCE